MTATVTDIHKHMVQQSIQGNSKARYELYRQYSKAMFNTCMRFLNNREDAEDMLQEVFCEAFNKMHTFRFDSTFGAWLKRITVNKCINELKRRKVSFSLIDEMEKFDAPEDVEDVEYHENVKYTAEKIIEAMEQLPEGSKVVFSLFMLEGYEHSEISEILKISESTSKTQLMRAKEKIRILIEQMKKSPSWNQMI